MSGAAAQRPAHPTPTQVKEAEATIDRLAELTEREDRHFTTEEQAAWRAARAILRAAPAPVHCEFGDHDQHDGGMVDDYGNCPGLLPEPEIDGDPTTAESVEEHQANLDAAYAADALWRVRRYAAYGDLVEAPDEGDLAALDRWRARTQDAKQGVEEARAAVDGLRDRTAQEGIPPGRVVENATESSRDEHGDAQ